MDSRHRALVHASRDATRSWTHRAATLVLALALAASATRAQTPDAAARPVLRAGALNGELRLDGRLDERAWADADSIANLVQIEPVQGEAPSGRTVVRVLVGADAVVFGVRADDPDPARITSFARERDANLSNEDHIRLVLDTYLDGRSGYIFIVNPNGARYDALAANQGESENAQWDTPWEAAAARTATGWSVEIRVPVKSLLFRRGLDQWGFNVERRVQRLLERSRWASPSRDVKINQTSRAGLLAGLPTFDIGAGLSVRPSFTASAGKPAPGASMDGEGALSLDVTKRVGGNTQASATFNTDFAQTEVDTRRTNLTRFPLLFPEKRTFFLEGSDIFDFGLGLDASSWRGSDLIPFFSRRVGLLGGREVPLDVGTKVIGREGGTSFGAIVARTGALDTLPTANTMGVVRVKQNILRESHMGVIASAGDPVGRTGSWMAGSDFTFQTTRFRGDKNFLAGAWFLAMGRDNEAVSGDPVPPSIWGKRYAFGGKIDYPNDLWDVALRYKYIGDEFDPSLSFVPRRGVQIVNFDVTHQPRPSRPIFGLRVRQMMNESLNTLVTDLDGKWESYRIFMAPINWRLESGDRIEANVVPTGERLVAPFEIADGVIIPEGSYHWNRYRLETSLASKRVLSGQFTWWFGDFYTGTLDEYTATASWKPSALFNMELNVTRNEGRLAEGDFTQQVAGVRLRLNLSPDLQFNSYLQYDNQSESFGTNTRARWTFSPVGDVFVVYNHNVNELTTALGAHRGWGFSSNQLLVKVQYAFRY